MYAERSEGGVGAVTASAFYFARGAVYNPLGKLVGVAWTFTFADGHRKSGSQRVTNFHATTTTKMMIPAKYAQPRPFWSFSWSIMQYLA